MERTLLKEEIKASFSAKIGYALFMRKTMKRFKKRMNSDEVGGSLLFGVDGVIVKAHGASSAYAFSKGIERCLEAVKSNFIDIMRWVYHRFAKDTFMYQILL